MQDVQQHHRINSARNRHHDALSALEDLFALDDLLDFLKEARHVDKITLGEQKTARIMVAHT